MIKGDFSTLIEDPKKLDIVNSSDIQAVVDEFPYCQPAHLLLARKLRKDDNMLFEKQLNLTAAYAPSRKVLYDLIHDNKISFEDHQEVMPPVVGIEIKEEIAGESPAEIIKDTRRDELDQLIQSESISSYNLPEQEVTAHKGKNEIKVDERKKLLFSDWVRYLDGEEVSDLEGDTEIINRFIENQPRINQHDDERVSIENLARSSSEDLSDEYVTETLAKIHLDQGNRSKAVEIYERLKLKYPEKSPYFAAQIQFIKQK